MPTKDVKYKRAYNLARNSALRTLRERHSEEYRSLLAEIMSEQGYDYRAQEERTAKSLEDRAKSLGYRLVPLEEAS